MSTSSFNPFPGLRPFDEDEDYLFFGRERHTDEVLSRLRTERFLAVVGPSGSGKSSLVRAGLIPSLHAGYMARAGSRWRIAVFRPGSNPIANLAQVLNDQGVLGRGGGEVESDRAILEANLWNSALGLVDCVAQANLPAHDNLLILVDQFEELFRFARLRGERDEATAFVRLLLAAVEQRELPIYVVLTMRTDFLEQCTAIDGLPEVINRSQYLVGRMTRDEMRAAIVGPVAVGQEAIAHRLVVRLVNDFGDDPDQLPVLQHTLMRIWEHWQDSASGEEIDLADYEAVGVRGRALSAHADEIYDELTPPRQAIAETLFKAVTEASGDREHGVRRPVALGEVAVLAGAQVSEVEPVVDAFRSSHRSFLMPPPAVPLEPDSVLDISHEALMRNWRRLVRWVAEERLSADYYQRVVKAAEREPEDGLWQNPRLGIHLEWRRRQHPTAAWAARYDTRFGEAMDFLDRSLRRQRWRRAGVLAMVALLVGLAIAALYLEGARRLERTRGELERAKTELAKQENVELAAALEEAEQQRQAAQAATREAEDAREDERAARLDAEEQKEKAEAARQDAELARETAEDERSKADAARQDAEQNLEDLQGQVNEIQGEYQFLRTGLAKLAETVDAGYGNGPRGPTAREGEGIADQIDRLNSFLGGAAKRVEGVKVDVQTRLGKPLARLVVLGQSDDSRTALTSAITAVLAREGSTRYVPIEKLREEEATTRTQGVSIAFASAECETASRRYTIFDFPSHGDAVKGLLTGTVPAEGAILIVGEAGAPSNRAREQLEVARRTGVEQIVVYQEVEVEPDPEAEAAAVQQARALLESSGYGGEEPTVVFGPPPAATDDDLTLRNSIDRLMSELDDHVGLPERAIDQEFLMPIEDVFTISGRGTVVTGLVERGVVRVGEEVEIVGIRPTAKTVVIGVEMFKKLLDQGQAGDNIGVLLRGIQKEDVERGQVLALPGSITPHTRFEGWIYLLTKEEGGRHTPFFSGYRPQFYFRTTDVTGVATLPEGTEMVMPGDNVNLTVELIAPIAMEKGVRFAIREGGRTVGVGVIVEVVE